mmetsp:Transcript_5468/g.12469  ORF Transcript_5468/g.12469 Transcript_5468/m.12469 type:complete len:136 (+) Transcript_5468:121-528(+)|eukprot:CAMPEP_0172310694 /NCGR_PEP_ID=MMETSP1058-20130122/12501_1 /TAXON_ID=83371 /ORGANISM="Detonula confervacea, Strain CCMP 353" /LENGTH=135 /DNA_ID=CAMNT_0013023609 /DNA_START=67 /DNA_END=477 /DNA_ORIENTATION=-
MPNIFATEENLVLAFPLLAVCSTYAFFKFIPLKIGLPLVGTISLLFQARAKLIASRSTEEHIDKTIVKDLVSDEDALHAQKEAKAGKKQRKADQKLRERIKAERRKTTNSNKETANDDDEGEMITKFAKGSRKNK